jgi:hypothetical protein
VHHYAREWTALRKLAKYTVETHFSHLLQGEDASLIYAAWYKDIVRLSAKMVAKWQAVGFCHGVLNTDNMSILGLTLDLGPFGFLENYDPQWICNQSDDDGMYAFGNQPYVVWWNLKKLGVSISTLLADSVAWNVQMEEYDVSQWEFLETMGQTIAAEALVEYWAIFQSEYMRLMANKLGLEQVLPADATLIQPLLDILRTSKVDYTRFFRLLSETPLEEVENALNASMVHGLVDAKAWSSWCSVYRQRVQNDVDRLLRMQQVNPRFVLKNWIAQELIQQTEEGDHNAVQEALKRFTSKSALFGDEQDPMIALWMQPTPKVRFITCD